MPHYLSRDAVLLPPTLLPVLHDCAHQTSPQWFRELEHIYQHFDNYGTLALEAMQVCFGLINGGERQRARTGFRGLLGLCGCAGRPKKVGRMKDIGVDVRERWWRWHWNWAILALVRADYLTRSLKFPVRADLGAVAAGQLPPHQHLLDELPFLGLSESERAHLAAYGVHPPRPPADLPPAYRPSRPASSSCCVLLNNMMTWARSQGALSRAESAAVMYDGDGDGEETAWECSQKAVAPGTWDRMMFPPVKST